MLGRILIIAFKAHEFIDEVRLYGPFLSETLGDMLIISRINRYIG